VPCVLAACACAQAAHVTVIGHFGHGYNPILRALEDTGLAVSTENSLRTAGPDGPATLEGTDLLLALPADYPPDLTELLASYVEGGGALLILVPEAPPPSLARLCASVGVPLERQSSVPRGPRSAYRGMFGHLARGDWPAGPEPTRLMVYSGWKLAPVDADAQVLVRTADRFSSGVWRDSSEPVAIKRPLGEGSVIVCLDFVGPQQLLWDLSGESLRLFVGLAADELGLPVSHTDRGRFTRFIPGADKRVKTDYRMLIVPARYSLPAHPQLIARLLADRVAEETGLHLSAEIAPPVEPAQAADRYPDALAFYNDVKAAAGPGLSDYDVLVALTSDTLPAFNTDARSYLGVWFSGRDRPDSPYGVVIAGGSDEVRDAEWDAQKREWVSTNRRRAATLGSRGIVHALMHEFGHHIGFPDYVAPPPYIMSGYYRNSELEYSELFKERLCVTMIAAAEAGLAQSGADREDHEELSRLIAIADRHLSRGSPRAGLDAALRVLGRL